MKRKKKKNNNRNEKKQKNTEKFRNFNFDFENCIHTYKTCTEIMKKSLKIAWTNNF
jgi:hypothetical protein